MSKKSVLARGTIYHAFAKVVIFILNLIVTISVAKYLGVKMYGSFGIIMSLSSIISVLVFNGVLDAVTKHVADGKYSVSSIVYQSIIIMSLYCTLISILCFFQAKTISNILHNDTLVPLIKLISFTFLPFTITGIFMGVLGGMRNFGHQIVVLIINSVSKATFIFICIWKGFLLYGITFGYVISLLPGMILVMFLSRIKKGTINIGYSKIGHSIFLLTFFHIIYVVLIHTDILFVQRILNDSKQTGLFTAASTISRCIWFFFATFGTTLLPSISSSISQNNHQLTKKYIIQSTRYMTILLIPSVVIISAFADKIILFLYSSEFKGAGNVLSILVFSAGMFCFYNLLNTVINAGGQFKLSVSIGLFVFTVFVILNYLLIPRYGITGAGFASLSAFLSGVLVTSLYVYRKYRVLIDFSHLAKIVFISIIIYLIADKLPFSGYILIPVSIGLLLLYFLCLGVIKGIDKNDILVIKNAVFQKSITPSNNHSK